jgi:hypothetical protein
LESASLKILQQGKAHVNTITFSGELIEGEIDIKNTDSIIKSILEKKGYYCR